MIEGVGPDTPTVTNEKGAKQSALPYRFDLIDAPALFNLANILYTGAEKYGDNNWRNISIKGNLNRAISHAYAYLAGDNTDDHLGHAFCRMMFALALNLDTNKPSSEENLFIVYDADTEKYYLPGGSYITEEQIRFARRGPG